MPRTLEPPPPHTLNLSTFPPPLPFLSSILPHSQLPLNDPRVAAALEVFECALASGQPWAATDTFITCVRDGSKGVMDVGNRDGDPTGE